VEKVVVMAEETHGTNLVAIVHMLTTVVAVMVLEVEIAIETDQKDKKHEKNI